MEDLKAQFEKAAEDIKQKGKDLKLSNDEQLNLYKYFKQVTVGDVNTKEPGFISMPADKAKWKAWNSVKGTSKDEAMTKYIEIVRKYI